MRALFFSLYLCIMTKVTLVKKIFLNNKLGISLTYGLFALEIGGSVVKPLLLGYAIDGVIEGKYDALINLCIVQVVWMFISVLRMRMDTRVYSKIYTSIVTTFINKNYKAEEVSKLSARSTLAHEIVNFFEYDLGYVLSSASNLIGAIIMIYFYNTNVFWTCMLLSIPVIVISYLFSKRIKILNRNYNDEYEKQVDIISSGNKADIAVHYDNMRKWQIKLSDRESFNFGYLEIISIILVAATLLIVKNTATVVVTTGMIVGIYNYILKFVGGLESIPHLLQRITNLSDILSRIEIKEDDL